MVGRTTQNAERQVRGGIFTDSTSDYCTKVKRTPIDARISVSN